MRQRWERLGAGGLLLLFLLVVVGVGIWRWRFGEASYAGKRVSRWFAEAGGLSDLAYDPSVSQAFIAMEGDAVPYLIRQLEQHWQTAEGRQRAWVSGLTGWALRSFGIRTAIGWPSDRPRVALHYWKS